MPHLFVCGNDDWETVDILHFEVRRRIIGASCVCGRAQVPALCLLLIDALAKDNVRYFPTCNCVIIKAWLRRL